MTAMQSIVLEIPQSIAVQLKLPPKRAQQMLMEELTARLYEQGIITAAQGCLLLNMKRLEFERFLAGREIPIHGEPEELDTDAANAGKAA
jgi:predicted HTH domain antitoxin